MDWRNPDRFPTDFQLICIFISKLKKQNKQNAKRNSGAVEMYFSTIIIPKICK